MWALVLCVVLLLVAATSSHAATAGPMRARTAAAHVDRVALGRGWRIAAAPAV